MTLTDARSATAPSAEELVIRVRELQPLLAKNSAQGEKALLGRDDQITPLI
jgi:hypothetical protein